MFFFSDAAFKVSGDSGLEDDFHIVCLPLWAVAINYLWFTHLIDYLIAMSLCVCKHGMICGAHMAPMHASGLCWQSVANVM